MNIEYEKIVRLEATCKVVDILNGLVFAFRLTLLR